MREIKYRFWNTDKNEWISPVLIELDQHGKFIHLYNEPFIASEFIGWHDCDGKEMFDGDIVEHGMSTIPKEYFALKYVRRHEEKLIWEFKTLDIDTYGDAVDFVYETGPNTTRWCRVVGNIYENPFLI